jgi:small nuclear ribonucleoprotein F
MNIQLSNTDEYINRKRTETLGQVLIRCNNVLWISAADADGADKEGKMEE